MTYNVFSGTLNPTHSIGNLLQQSLIDSSSDEGLKPDDMNGTIELKNVTFRFPSREEVPVISETVFTGDE